MQGGTIKWRFFHKYLAVSQKRYNRFIHVCSMCTWTSCLLILTKSPAIPQQLYKPASRGLSAIAELLVYIYICSFITFLSYYSKTAFLDCLHKSFVLTGIDQIHANQFLVFFHLNFCLIPLSRLIWVPRQFLMARRIHSCIIIMMGRGVVLS